MIWNLDPKGKFIGIDPEGPTTQHRNDFNSLQIVQAKFSDMDFAQCGQQLPIYCVLKYLDMGASKSIIFRKSLLANLS